MRNLVKKISIAGICLFSHGFYAQEKSSELSNKVKINLLSLPLAMPNIAFETKLSPHYSMQISSFISPWKSFKNNHLQAYMGFLEGRYYFSQFGEKWFAGPNIGVGVFDIAKWNYWNSGKFQRGYSIFFGVTGGYAWKWKKNLGFETFISVGTSQGFYHGYESTIENINRYEKTYKRWNRSGEFIPYQGGIMLTYSL